jgi:hypothetical protein
MTAPRKSRNAAEAPDAITRIGANVTPEVTTCATNAGPVPAVLSRVSAFPDDVFLSVNVGVASSPTISRFDSDHKFTKSANLITSFLYIDKNTKNYNAIASLKIGSHPAALPADP